MTNYESVNENVNIIMFNNQVSPSSPTPSLPPALATLAELRKHLSLTLIESVRDLAGSGREWNYSHNRIPGGGFLKEF